MSKKKLSNAGTSHKIEKPVVVDEGPKPINQMDANLFQNLVQVSNQYGKLKQQKDEFEMALKQLESKRTDIASGKIPLPILMPLGKNKFYSCTDKKAALDELDIEIKVLSNAVIAITGQLINYKDSYIEAGLKVTNFLTTKFNGYKPKTSCAPGCSPTKEEKVIFTSELDTLEKQELVKEAIEDAKKHNDALKAI
jgi:hypothetical protein